MQELSIATGLAPVFRYFWVVVIGMFLAGVGYAGLLLMTPEDYETTMVLAMVNQTVVPESVVILLTAGGVDAQENQGKVIAKLRGRERTGLPERLQAAVDLMSEQWASQSSGYTEQAALSVAKLQDTITLLGAAEATAERIVLSERVIETTQDIRRLTYLASLESPVVTLVKPGPPRRVSQTFVLNNMIVSVLLGLFGGLGMAYMLEFFRQYKRGACGAAKG